MTETMRACEVCGELKVPTVEFPAFDSGAPRLAPIGRWCEECAKVEEAKEKRATRRERIALAARQLPHFGDTVEKRVRKNLRSHVRSVIIHNRMRGIFIWGVPGTWKTRALCDIGAAMILQGKSLLWLNCPLMLLAYTDTLKDAKAMAIRTVRDYVAPDILVIDDYGKGKVTERGSELLYTVVNRRFEKRKPIWYTSNHAPEHTKTWFTNDTAKYGDSIMRRIRESCKEVRA